MKYITTVCVCVCMVCMHTHTCSHLGFVYVCTCVCVQSEYLREEGMENPMRFISPLSLREALKFH